MCWGERWEDCVDCACGTVWGTLCGTGGEDSVCVEQGGQAAGGGLNAEEGMGQTETLCNLECSVCIFIGILLLYSSFLRTVNASLKIL